jgi:predicted Zn finger-like uncharacterized protein
MLISCQNCATSYQVDAASLGPTGRSVRCARCRQVWFAANPAALAEIADAFRTDVAAFAATTHVADLVEPPPPPAVDAGVEMPLAPDLGAQNLLESLAAPLPTVDEVAATAPLSPDLPAHDIGGQQPIQIINAPALAPMIEGEITPAAAVSPASEDIETVALRRAKLEAQSRRFRWPLAALPTAVLALIALNVALIGWRSHVVRWVPQTASLYAAIGLPVNLRGLVFANVTTTKEIHDGVPVLVVEGTITSTVARAAEVPRLRFAVRNAAGQEIYNWTAQPPRNVLGPGATMPFRSRLASPPRDGHDVLVRFFNRRDLVAGVQ